MWECRQRDEETLPVKGFICCDMPAEHLNRGLQEQLRKKG